jgi:hypothetical protein
VEHVFWWNGKTCYSHNVPCFQDKILAQGPAICGMDFRWHTDSSNRMVNCSAIYISVYPLSVCSILSPIHPTTHTSNRPYHNSQYASVCLSVTLCISKTLNKSRYVYMQTLFVLAGKFGIQVVVNIALAWFRMQANFSPIRKALGPWRQWVCRPKLYLFS